MTHFIYLLGLVFMAITFLMLSTGALLIRFGFFPGIESLWPVRHLSKKSPSVAPPVENLSTPLSGIYSSIYIEIEGSGNLKYSQKHFASRSTASSVYARETSCDSEHTNELTKISSINSLLSNVKFNTSANIHHLDNALRCS
jgi:hypothetical protein